jgi:ATP-dependent DNA helicase PIF1
LTLKKGELVMLSPNPAESCGLCNGTRLMVKELGTHIIEAQTISGAEPNSIVYITRISLHAPEKDQIPCRFSRRQLLI